MKSLMEKQLSWLALLITAFYSLLASCRAEKCGHEEIVRCARPLEKLSSNDLSFATKKEQLQQLCPDLEAGMKCIKTYTLKCLKEEQRELFNNLYSNTNMAIMELCQDGPYQEKFLEYAPCVQKVQAEYELCYKRYQRTTQEIERVNRTAGDGSVKSVCCAFKEYLDCSHHTVRRKCGDDTAQFAKEFLDRMSSSLLQMHCTPYTDSECAIGSGGSILRIEILLPTMLLVVARYFT